MNTSSVLRLLEEKVAAASPGPWLSLEALGAHHETGEPFTSWVIAYESSMDSTEDVGEAWTEADGEIIALAPQALTVLVAMAKALEQILPTLVPALKGDDENEKRKWCTGCKTWVLADQQFELHRQYCPWRAVEALKLLHTLVPEVGNVQVKSR